jgi:peptidoglycan hydrolase-like protein with peptidoglycan-binding domain
MGLPAAAAKYARLQQALNKLTDARLVVDGKMGKKAKAAIRAYQKSRGLVVDGVAGKMTIAAIDADLSSQGLQPIG